MQLVLLSTDLMISSLVAGAALQHELTVVTVSDQAAALTAAREEQTRVLVVDLRLAGLDIAALIGALRDAVNDTVRVVAFGPHVHEANLAAAREAGCDEVVTRGQFDREAAQIFGGMV